MNRLERLVATLVRGAAAGVLSAGAFLTILAYQPGPGADIAGPPPSGATPTPAPTPTPGASPPPGASPDPGGSPMPPTPAPSGTPAPTRTPTPTPTPVAGLRDGRWTGTNVDYRYGFMQVTITVSGGTVVDASVAQTGAYPIGYRNTSCTEQVFNSLALTVTSGKELYGIQFCSGATYSKSGYANSLQSALDQAAQ